MASSGNVAVDRLIEYIRIKTVHPDPDYDSAVKFIKKYSDEIGFDSYKEIEVSPNRIVCLLSYYGDHREKPSILLNSHTDVVPVDQDYWICDAFEGKRFDNGDIYGRGTQDMKSVGIQYMELIRKMKQNNVRPKRSIHVVFTPDEEIGGLTGFAPFIKTQEFKDLNVGVAIDEGVAKPTEEYYFYYAERLSWWINFTIRGNTGHGSRFIEKTAADKLHRLLNKFLQYREEQKAKLKDQYCCFTIGDVNTVNLTKISGGVATNVVPGELKASFDVRISPKSDLEEFKNLLHKWIDEAEGDDKDSGRITYDIDHTHSDFSVTSLDEDKNPYWRSFKTSCEQLGIKLKVEISAGGADSRFLRMIGIPAFNFTALNHTPELLHDHNERINENVFLNGIDILYRIVLDIANLE